MTPNEKVEAALKRAFMEGITNEYVRSSHSSLTDFLYHIFIQSGKSTYLPNYIGDAEILKDSAEYNDANVMNDALE